MTETERLVCIVEDEPSLRGALGILLTAAGFTTAAFESAEDFLAFPQWHAVGCILLDIGLPGIDGFELQARVAERDHGPRVIFMSGRAVEPELRAWAVSLGAVTFLEKPFRERDLIDAVRLALA